MLINAPGSWYRHQGESTTSNNHMHTCMFHFFWHLELAQGKRYFLFEGTPINICLCLVSNATLLGTPGVISFSIVPKGQFNIWPTTPKHGRRELKQADKHNWSWTAKKGSSPNWTNSTGAHKRGGISNYTVKSQRAKQALSKTALHVRTSRTSGSSERESPCPCEGIKDPHGVFREEVSVLK